MNVSVPCNGRVTVVIVCALGSCLHLATAGEQKSDEARGRAAIVANSAHVGAFPFYRCTYRTTRAQAKSLQEALDGRFLNARFWDNRLLVSGKLVLYEGLAPLPDKKKAQPSPDKKGTGTIPSSGDSHRYLSDGQREMSYEPFLEAINLFSGEKEVRGIPASPLNAGSHHRTRVGPEMLLQQPESWKERLKE